MKKVAMQWTHLTLNFARRDSTQCFAPWNSESKSYLQCFSSSWARCATWRSETSDKVASSTRSTLSSSLRSRPWWAWPTSSICSSSGFRSRRRDTRVGSMLVATTSLSSFMQYREQLGASAAFWWCTSIADASQKSGTPTSCFGVSTSLLSSLLSWRWSRTTRKIRRWWR